MAKKKSMLPSNGKALTSTEQALVSRLTYAEKLVSMLSNQRNNAYSEVASFAAQVELLKDENAALKQTQLAPAPEAEPAAANG